MVAGVTTLPYSRHYGKVQYTYIDIHKNEGICLIRLFVRGLWGVCAQC
jgi:hypothetical protein